MTNLQIKFNQNNDYHSLMSKLLTTCSFKVDDSEAIPFLFEQMELMPIRDMFPKSLGYHAKNICVNIELTDDIFPVENVIDFGDTIKSISNFQTKCDADSKEQLNNALASLASCQFGFDVDENAETKVEAYPEFVKSELFIQSKFFKTDLKAYFDCLEEASGNTGFFNSTYTQLVDRHNCLKDTTVGNALRYAFEQVPESTEVYSAFFIKLRYADIVNDILVVPFTLHEKQFLETAE